MENNLSSSIRNDLSIAAEGIASGEVKKDIKKEALKELAKRELAKRNLLYFIQYNFPNYKINWHHRLIAQKLMEVAEGKVKRLLITVPPRHGKSELCSIQFPAYFVGTNPKKEIIAASYSADLATEFGRKVRNLVDSQEYKNIFRTKLAEDSKSAGKWHTDQGGAYTATGVGGAITGKGADILIIDDPIKNREDADSPLIREKLWDWYRSTAYTRLMPGGAVIIIQTRWHDDDLAGKLLKEKEGDVWDIVQLPAIAEKDEEFRKVGEALWEEQYSLEQLEATKKVLGNFEFSALYQQDPVDRETQEFKSKFFQSRTMEDLRKLNTRAYLTIDTAISKKSSADYTGFCINWIDTENKWTFKAWKKRISPTELIATLFDLHQLHRFYKIGIEKTIYLQAIKPFLDEEMRKRNKFLPIVDLKHNQSAKETRIRGLIPLYESFSVYHLKDECFDLEEELMRFPKAAHDDVADAAAYQLQITEGAPTMNQIDFKLYVQDYT